MLKSFENAGKHLIHLICFVLKVANGATIFSTISDHISNNIPISKIQLARNTTIF